MTGPRRALHPSTITVEFGCERQCQVELDLSEAPARMTLGMMQDRAENAHEAAHEAEPVKVFTHRAGVNHSVVRANVPDGATC